MAETPKTILLKVNSRHEDRPFDEAPAAAAGILPGYMVDFDSTGDVAVHGTAAAFAAKWVAIENPYIDPTVVTTAAIDTAYAVSDYVRFVRAQAGDMLYMLLVDEGNAAIGSPLTSQGDGTLKVGTPATDHIIGVAAEAVDNTGGTGAVRIRVYIA